MTCRDRVLLCLVPVVWMAVACGDIHQKRSELEAATRTPEQTKVRKDENGNVLKKDGWFSTNFKRGERSNVRSEEVVTADGRKITIEIANVNYPKPLVIDQAFGDFNSGQDRAAGKTNWGTEIRGKQSSNPYCIHFVLHLAAPPVSKDNSFHDHGVSTRFCDADGDGIFETRASGDFPVPAWVE
jgi:hypothetical protein